ncbi:DNA repair and recombination protein RAD54 [Histoplasma capsulatum G186AR]|uniref:DNA repair and recombination protein RAD54 n=1 Tax=Ajellomyces capsulatus TaxID=5037 RepID=A0A8H8D6K6_AJECA|nr:DNA repair and recombination protein RAD54 [Histoplasma capsulatum]QSS69123.1 DNA repair and recombination protein RAD54 [Histoplasma capsulatum G186AR]
MDPSVQRLLSDKLYDKRKQGALELERIIRDALVKAEHTKIKTIVDQLCHEYAYAVHQPHTRNGGLIGLAAASIALGTDEVAPYLYEIVPPVLACFTDQDARVRYYACESMYNIAKVAKGELLLFFNDIFDALCKLASDSELSVKNGADLLDRLVKDIVSESAASYVSVLQAPKKVEGDSEVDGVNESEAVSEVPTAFSLANFIPLLKQRIHVINPFTRTFLVSWLSLLDTIPDLELVYYLPAFLEGLFRFLSDPNRDVHTITQGALETFLSEIKKIARIKKGIAYARRDPESGDPKPSATSDSMSVCSGSSDVKDISDNAIADSDSGPANDGDVHVYGDYVPGQDVHVDHPKILEILLGFVDTAFEEEIQLTALRWIDSFFEISPEDILQFVPRLLSQVLPALSSGSNQVREAANRVNTSLMQYIVSLTDDIAPDDPRPTQPSRVPTGPVKETDGRRSSTPTGTQSDLSAPNEVNAKKLHPSRPASTTDLTSRSSSDATPIPSPDLDYAAAVSALTLQFLNENEETRVASLAWLIMLHRKAPRKVLAFHDGTFPALLKTLSDPSEAVVTRDLQLLSQISRNTDDGYFTSFMVNLLQLFSTDRKLLEIRGNLIIRQLCVNLSPERIYRTLADCLEKEEDIEFASIMVQNLNNNLITAPELADMRKRLRNPESRDGQMFFVALFRSWCHNAVATFSLCLLAQAYEQAYNLLQIFAELEMTVNMLIQIDKLVQLLESPVFTYLRLQLLEPEKYPYLYKCLYGVLMLLPQSSAFAALKNRLNSVSNIGLLQPAARGITSNTPSIASSYERPGGRLKSREDIRWGDLLEKFKRVQEKSRRSGRSASRQIDPDANGMPHSSIAAAVAAATAADQNGNKEKGNVDSHRIGIGTGTGSGLGSGHVTRTGFAANEGAPAAGQKTPKSRSALGNLGRLSGIGQRKSKR